MLKVESRLWNDPPVTGELQLCLSDWTKCRKLIKFLYHRRGMLVHILLIAMTFYPMV